MSTDTGAARLTEAELRKRVDGIAGVILSIRDSDWWNATRSGWPDRAPPTRTEAVAVLRHVIECLSAQDRALGEAREALRAAEHWIYNGGAPIGWNIDRLREVLAALPAGREGEDNG